MKRALIVVDVQNDFCEGGNLAVIGGSGIVPVINTLIKQFIANDDVVIATRELHPTNHTAFASVHGEPPSIDKELWPDHCIVGTVGAEFHPDLDLKNVAIFSKGKDANDHPYSAFAAIGDKSDKWLYDYLVDNNVTSVYVCGLALDFCVMFTALDSIENGFYTVIIQDATAAVQTNMASLQKTLKLKFIDIKNSTEI